jgi:hypothetical protein
MMKASIVWQTNHPKTFDDSTNNHLEVLVRARRHRESTH